MGETDETPPREVEHGSRRHFLKRAGQTAVSTAAAGVLFGPGLSGTAEAAATQLWFNIVDYGAVPYAGRALALAGTDSYAAVQAAASAAADPESPTGSAQFPKQAGIVYIPAGNYKVTHQVDLPPGVSVVGDGFSTSVLHSTMTTYGGGSNEAVLKGSDYSVGAHFRNFGLHGPGHAACDAGYAFSTGNNGAVGLHPGIASSDVTIAGVYVEGYTNGIMLRAMKNVRMSAVYVYAAKETNLVIGSTQNLICENSFFSNGGMGGGTGDLAPWRSNIYVSRLGTADSLEYPKYIEFIDCWCDEVYSGTSIILDEVNDFLWDGGQDHVSADERSNHVGVIWSGSDVADKAIYVNKGERIKFTNVTVQPWGYGNPAMTLIDVTADAVDVDLGGATIDLETGTPYKPSVVGTEVADAGTRTILPGVHHMKAHTMADHTDGPYGAGDADYLVGTANADVANGIAVGTTPGGELKGTWAEPKVDATHAGSRHLVVATFFFPGALAPSRGKLRWPIYQDSTILSCEARCSKAPTGAPIVVDVNRGVGDGASATLYTSGTRPTIPAGAKSGSSVPGTKALAAGDYLVVDVDSVGSIGAGANMTVSVVMALE